MVAPSINAVLSYFPTAEGYIDYTPGPVAPGYNYVYQYKDHLGNIRMNYAYSRPIKGSIGSVFIKDESHYYPFGLKHTNYNVDYLEFQQIDDDVILYPPISTTGKLPYNYKYNGKELQDELGLNMYDYGARNYDPALGRWMNIDPLADEYADYSPYAYVFNDPIRHTDPDGMAPDDIVIYGANNSSLTIKTDLIDVSVNAGGLIGDIGGNYTVSGSEILGAALDIVGIFDPTGVADGLNASLQASEGNWGDALISSAGIIPFAGDLAKVGKIEKDIKILGKAVDAAKGADKVRDAAKAESKVAKAGDALPTPGKGKGSVPPGQRDPKRVYSEKQKTEMLDKQGGKCAGCGETKTVKEVAGHHKVRHADGGKTTMDNGAAVCKDCHTKIHQ